LLCIYERLIQVEDHSFDLSDLARHTNLPLFEAMLERNRFAPEIDMYGLKPDWGKDMNSTPPED
jgi:hypothetical protein